MNLQEYKKLLQPFRILDIQDLYIMRGLYYEEKQCVIARELNVSPSTICARLIRYRESFGDDFFIKEKGKSILTKKGILICGKAKLMFDYLMAEMN